MARKNVVTIDTNVTPEQAATIEKLCTQLDVARSHLLRMALAQFVERNNGEWPTAEIKHGGNRHPPTIKGSEN